MTQFFFFFSCYTTIVSLFLCLLQLVQNFVSLDESVHYVRSARIVLLVLKNTIFLTTLFILWLKINVHSWIRRTEKYQTPARKNNIFSMISTRHLSSKGKNENKLTCTWFVVYVHHDVLARSKVELSSTWYQGVDCQSSHHRLSCM